MKNRQVKALDKKTGKIQTFKDRDVFDYFCSNSSVYGRWDFEIIEEDNKKKNKDWRITRYNNMKQKIEKLTKERVLSDPKKPFGAYMFEYTLEAMGDKINEIIERLNSDES